MTSKSTSHTKQLAHARSDAAGLQVHHRRWPGADTGANPRRALLAALAESDTPPAVETGRSGAEPASALAAPPSAAAAGGCCRRATRPRNVGKCSGRRSALAAAAGAGAALAGAAARHCGGGAGCAPAPPRAGKASAPRGGGPAAAAAGGRCCSAAPGGGARTSCESGAMPARGRAGAGDARRGGVALGPGSGSPGEAGRACSAGVDRLCVRLGNGSAARALAAGPGPSPAPGLMIRTGMCRSLARLRADLDVPASQERRCGCLHDRITHACTTIGSLQKTALLSCGQPLSSWGLCKGRCGMQQTRPPKHLHDLGSRLRGGQPPRP